ncbi:MAG: tetratricopeptide repeat protein [Gammaproteobacteria bacterium]|nr:tetratricopeptide repeat protein [Gammaproteobacteria bacterium]
MKFVFLNSRGFAVAALSAVLLGCVGIDIDTQFSRDENIHAAIIDQSSDRYPEIDPLYISDEVKQFIDSYIQPRDGEETRVDKLQDLLYGEDFLHIQYSSERTHTAMEAYYAREGNCLGVMNLYIAMARYVGLDANFQTVEVQPSWDLRGDLLVLSQHINASGKISARRTYVVDFTPEISLQQLTSNVVSDRVARSLYFNNLGVEELLEGNYEGALVYFKNALYLNEDSSIAWNNIGSNYNRLGNVGFAEYAYRMAFSLDDNNATAINNLAKYYRRSGNFSLAAEYTEAIERFNNRNPYYHFAQGSVEFDAGNFDEARRSFRKAVRLKGEEPNFYYALAGTYLRLGNESEAKRWSDTAGRILALYDNIYQPSNNKVKIIDSASILRDSSYGISIYPPGTRRNN